MILYEEMLAFIEEIHKLRHFSSWIPSKIPFCLQMRNVMLPVPIGRGWRLYLVISGCVLMTIWFPTHSLPTAPCRNK